MTETAGSLLLLAGLLAGSAGAFFIRIQLLPFYAIFPLVGLMGKSRKGMVRILVVGAAPACTLAYGLVTGSQVLTERSLRWIAAVAAGASLSGALGASRTSALLHRASRRMPLWGITESLAMVVSLAGPFSKRVRSVFRTSRSKGGTMIDSLTVAMSSLYDLESSPENDDGFRSVDMISALAAWILMLLGIAGA